MHSENPFNKEYNFNGLIQSHPKLSEFIILGKSDRKSINFGDSEAIIALNTALLKRTYDVNWELKPGHLCPALPGRLDYLIHVKDLLGGPPEKPISMLDIGTGASLIYPLLATAAFDWNCTASEVALDSLEFAEKLLSLNPNLKTTILRSQRFKSKVFHHVVEKNDYFDVVVCNPPFYKTQSEAEERNIRKNKNLHNTASIAHNFGGHSNELWYKGGEEAFIKIMATESASYKSQVGWFTCLISKSEHVKTLKRYVRKAKPAEVRVVEMEQGNKKSRFIAWTFNTPGE